MVASASSRSIPYSSRSPFPCGTPSYRTTTKPFSSSSVDTRILLTPVPIPESGVTVYTATSVYSQDSYLPLSPIPFSQSRVDRRRFCVMLVGPVPWTDFDEEERDDEEKVERSAASTSTPRLGMWSLDGEGGAPGEKTHEDEDGGEKDSVSPEDAYTFLAFSPISPPPLPLQLKMPESPAGDAHTVVMSPPPVPRIVKNGTASPPLVVPVMGTRKKVLSRMLSRLSVSSRRGTRLGLDSPPPLPPIPPAASALLPPSPLVPPPQIEVVVPSPGLNVNLDVVVVSSPSQPSHSSFVSMNSRMKKHNRTASEPIRIQPQDVLQLGSHMQARGRRKHQRSSSSTTPASSWKPARPASPLPRARHGRHKRQVGSVALPGRPSVPPLPVGAVSMSTTLYSPSRARRIKLGREKRVSTEMWAEVEGRLRARVMKSGMYACGVPSPLSGT